MGGGAVAFVAAVLLNRLLIGLGLNIQQHPETGGVTLTAVAIGVGAVGFVLGACVAPVRGVRQKLAELGAAAVGSLIAVYIALAIGAALGAFKGIHFHTERLTLIPVVVSIVVAAGSLVSSLRSR